MDGKGKGKDDNAPIHIAKPKDGESIINRVECTWCDWCKHWTSGDKCHSTEEHKTKSELSGSSTPATSQAENLAASELGGYSCHIFMELGMHNCVLHVEWLFSNTCSL